MYNKTFIRFVFDNENILSQDILRMLIENFENIIMSTAIVNKSSKKEKIKK